MLNKFCKEAEGIYRLRVPFDAIYTSVFLVLKASGALLVDCAATGEDVDQYIVPALSEMGYALSDIEALILTHSHGDHAGGCSRVLSLAPKISVITDVCDLGEGISTYPMAGHTVDCIGVLDMRTHTLLSGDGLQGLGVDKYRCFLEDPPSYLQTVERLQKDKRIEKILFSHAYEPWNKDSVIGRSAVEACLSACIRCVNGESC